MSFKSIMKTIAKKVFGIGPETIEDYRKRGVKIGENVSMYSCEIDYGHGYLIEIGDNCDITHVSILTHDASTKRDLGYTKIARVRIGNNVFVGHNSVILPGTTIGDYTIIGAGSVVRGTIPPNSVVIGNPAQIICKRDEYMEKNRVRFQTAPRYETPWEEKTEEEKRQMLVDLDGRIGFDV